MSHQADRGLFITLEGVEGAGKSTQMTFIEDYIRQSGIALLVTREPGGTPLGEEIRQILLRPREAGMSHKAELMLMFAARAEHLERKIIPALEAGQWVLCDRFTDATYAYQGGGRGVDPNLIAELEKLAQGEIRPDVTIYLDLPVEVGLARVKSRGELDRFERESKLFFNNVRQAYLKRAADLPDIYHVIDASKDIDQVNVQIATVLEAMLHT